MPHPIPADELDFHPHSFADPRMRLFRWNGAIYRALHADAARMFRFLIEDGTLRALSEKGLLIETKESPLAVEGFEMVLEHRRIPFVSYASEWCAPMLKDAALVLVNLAIELAGHGYTLGDGHPWNLVFDFCRPLFVDVGSIMPVDDFSWKACDEFHRYCLYPLMLITHGQGQIARLLLCEDDGVRAADMERLADDYAARSNGNHSWRSALSGFANGLAFRLSRCVPRVLRRRLKHVAQQIPSPISSSAKEQAHLDFLQRVKAEVEAVQLPAIANDLPTEKSSPPASPEISESVISFFEKLKPASMLDVHCQNGAHAIAAARLGCEVVAFSSEENDVARLYQKARALNLPILPLLMDFTKPTPARGLGSHWAIAATERLRCDMVLALDFVHRIVRDRRLNFEHISEGLALFAKRWALVEFASPGDRDVDRAWAERFPNYTLDNFLHSLRKRFREVTVHPAASDRPRVLILCKK